MRGLVCVAAIGITLSACGIQPAATAVPTPTPRPSSVELERVTYTVKRGEVINEIIADGRVAATLQKELSFQQDGLLETLYVAASDVVTTGQVLAELDLGTLPNELDQAALELNLATEAQQRAASTRDLAIRRAQLDLEDAKAQVATLREGPKTEDVAAALARVREAEIQLQSVQTSQSAAKTGAELDVSLAANALRDAQDSYTSIHENNRVRYGAELPPEVAQAEEQARRQMEDAQTKLTAAEVAYNKARELEVTAIQDAQSALELARIALKALQAPPKKSDVDSAQRRVSQAELALEAAAQTTDPAVETRVARAQLEVDRLKQLIAARQLVAPFDGTIANVALKTGSNVSAYRTVITLIDATDIEVLMDAPAQTNLARIGVGQEVKLTFRSDPATPITGTIAQLPSGSSSVGSDPFVHIGFDRKAFEPRLGESVEISIPIERQGNALWLPPAAVRSTATRSFVVLREGDKDRRVDVKVGLVTPDRVEILEGLSEGQTVVGE